MGQKKPSITWSQNAAGSDFHVHSNLECLVSRMTLTLGRFPAFQACEQTYKAPLVFIGDSSAWYPWHTLGITSNFSDAQISTSHPVSSPPPDICNAVF